MIVTQERLHVISDNIHKMLNRGANQRIKKMFDRIHAADIALLFRTFSFHQRLKLISLISLPEKTAEVVSELDEEIKNELLTELPIDTMVEILSHMSSDDAADALGNLPEEISQKILALLPGEGKELEGLLQFDDETAGGLMSAEFFALEEKTTASEAINALQRAGDLEMAFYIYVINQHEHLVGVVSLRQLVIVAPETNLSEIMTTHVHRVKPETDQEAVAKIVARYNLLAVPVVDEDNRLLGIVTVDDIIDVIREEATEDIFKMAGVGSSFEEEHNILSGFKVRFPWLLASWLGGIVVFFIIMDYEKYIRVMPFLAAFIPVIIGMGGNIAAQSSTMVIRGLSTGRIIGQLPKVLGKQLVISSILGLVYGLMLGIFGHLQMTNSSLTGLLVGLSMMVSMIFSSLIGSVLPVCFARFNFDPTIASGPFVSTLIDIIGVLIYLNLAVLFLT